MNVFAGIGEALLLAVGMLWQVGWSLILGFALSGFLQSGTGINIPWWVFSIATAAIVWVLTYFGIRLSTRTTAILGGIEMLIMLALGITFLAHPGAGSSASPPRTG